MFKRLICAVALSFTLFSCAEDVIPDSIEIKGAEDNRITFAAAPEQSIQLTVTSSKAWNITKSSLTWLEVYPLSGDAGKDETITLTAADNKVHSVRSGSFTITCGTLSQTFTITQSAYVDPLTIDCTSRTMEFAANETAGRTFKLTSSVDWTISKSDLDWCDINPSSGSVCSATTITVTPQANASTASREGSFTIKAEGIEDIVFTVSQVGLVPELSVDKTALSFESAASSDKFSVTSNQPWSASCNQTWAHLSDSSGVASSSATEITVNVDQNTSTQRTATITVTAAGLTKTIAITQKASSDAEGEVLMHVDCTKGAAYIEAKSPDWSTQGANDYSNGSGKGIFNCEETGCYAQWVRPEANASLTKPDFISSAEGQYAVKRMWTDDALVFYVPVKSLAKGRTLEMTTGLQGTATCPRSFTIEYCIDGTNWVSSTTCVMSVDGAPVSYITKEKVSFLVESTYVLPSDVPASTISVRIRCTDGTKQIKGSTVTSQPKDGTLRFRDFPGTCTGPVLKIKNTPSNS